MPDHDLANILAVIADLYTPALLLMAFVLIAKIACSRNASRIIATAIKFGVLFLVVYGWMWLDKTFGLFALANLDYSTHTAAATALVYFLANNGRGYLMALGLSLTAYGYLMLFLDYHSIEDMSITLALIAASLSYLQLLYVRISVVHTKPPL